MLFRSVFARAGIYETFMQGPTGAIEFAHGYTYSAHPLACAAALATLDVYQDEGLLTRAAELEQHWEALRALPSLQWHGVMLIPPLALSGEPLLELFAEVVELADQLQLPGRSMGMSGDWREAAAAGATWVRVGSALFGARPQPG